MSHIARTPVTSSQIASIGHDPETNTLEIEFKSFTTKGKEPRPNSVYQYPNVTDEQHKALVEAESIGKHFGAHIKGNPDHPHQKIS